MSVEQYGLKHPLAAPTHAGIDTLRRLGLNTEASMDDDIETVGDFADQLVSVHAPVHLDGEVRLNIAAPEEKFRRRSIQRILAYIDLARRYPNVRKVNIHYAPKRWVTESQNEGQEGDDGLLIDGAREIADFAEQHRLEIVMENANAYWTDIPEQVPADEVDWSSRNGYFGMAPEEWIQVCEEVNRPNVGLCLDSSHTCTYAQTVPEDQREERVLAFLARPDLIRHVHWNDNYLYDARGRKDSHAEVGEGTLPVEMHRRIKELDATLLLEHFYSLKGLEQELEFVSSL